MAESLDRHQRQRKWLSWPLAVLYKLIDDQATSLAAMITYYGFVSLFPLLLLLVTCLGFAMTGDAALQQAVLHSALREFPIIGDQIGENVHSLRGTTAGVVVGVVGSIYGALGVALATQNAMNKIWAVPRADRPSLLAAYGRGLGLLAVLGAEVVVGTVLSALVTAVQTDRGGVVAAAVSAAAALGSVALNAVLLTLAYRVLTAHRPPLRQLWPGALTAAVLWEVLLAVGAYLVGHELRGASATYGLFGIVLGLIGWLYLGALILVLGAEINAVRAHRLYPRSLLAPDPNDRSLTPADRRAYAAYARTERQKTYQTVQSEFSPPPGPSTGGTES